MSTKYFPEALDVDFGDNVDVLSESQRFQMHLKKAEREIRWLRCIGMASWFIVLVLDGYTPAFNAIWFVYSIGVVYTVWSFVSAQLARDIKRTAVITTICDPIIAAAICYETEGINSIFYVYFYFTLLAAAFRFGRLALFGVAVFNVLLTGLLYNYVNATHANMGDLVVAIFYLGMVTALAAMMLGWVRENMGLVIEQKKSLEEAGGKLRMLLHRLINVEEEERKNISHVLHDSMSGRLFNMKLCLERLTATTDIGHNARKQLDDLATELEGCTQDVRAVMNELQPTVLEELGFYEAAEEYLTKLAEMADFELGVALDSKLRSWRSVDDVSLFRVLQEAILNIRKYASAGHVNVSLFGDGGMVLLVIDDDGQGFDPNDIPPGHYGLIGMKERVDSLGGKLKIRSRAGEPGTSIIVIIPKGDT